MDELLQDIRTWNANDTVIYNIGAHAGMQVLNNVLACGKQAVHVRQH